MPTDGLAAHPDQIRWNARYAADPPAPRPHPLTRQALAMGLPDGPVADLACGPSGSALLAAHSAGRSRRSTSPGWPSTCWPRPRAATAWRT